LLKLTPYGRDHRLLAYQPPAVRASRAAVSQGLLGLAS
jgi:hypothetical protein